MKQDSDGKYTIKIRIIPETFDATFRNIGIFANGATNKTKLIYNLIGNATITAKSSYNGSGISSFTVRIQNGSTIRTQYTSTGTITTKINSTYATKYKYNITFYNNTNHFNKTYLNYNFSAHSNTIQGNLTRSFTYLTIKDYYNSTTLTKINVTINNLTTYINAGPTTKLYLRNTTNFFNFSKIGYVNHSKWHTLNYSSNRTYNYDETYINVLAREINTLLYLQNFSIKTAWGYLNTTTSARKIYIFPLINYIWNFSNKIGYVNASNLAFSSPVSIDMNIYGLYATNNTFKDNITTTLSVYPTCIADNYTYTLTSILPLRMHKTTSNITCSLFGYANKVFQIARYFNKTTLYMQPSKLTLNFSAKNAGIVQSSDTIYTFNASSISIPQRNFTTGYVTISFNYYSGKYQQTYKYYNDQNTTLNDNLLLQTVNLVQSFRVYGNNQPISNARVCIKAPYNNTWWTTSCDYTDGQGNVQLVLADQTTYYTCVQAEGYTTTCSLQYVPPANQNIIQLNIESSTSGSEYGYIQSDCPAIVNSSRNCIITAWSNIPHHTIGIKLFRNLVGGTNTTTWTYTSDSVSVNFNYDIWGTTLGVVNQTVSIYYDSTLIKTFFHKVITYAPTTQIGTNQGNNSGYTIMERAKQTPGLLALMHILMLMLVVIGGYITEKHYKGKGIFGVELTCIIIALMGFYIFWVPGILIFIYLIAEKKIPMLR